MVCRLGSGWHLWFASLGIGKSKCCPAPNKLKSSPFSGHTFSGHTFSGHTFAGHTFSGHTFSGHTISGHTISGHTISQPGTRSDASACCSDAHQAHDCMDLTNCVTQ